MHQDPSFEKFLCSCMIPPKNSKNLPEESSTEELESEESATASVHDGKKPFKCESCDNSFHLKENLQEHVTTVHEGKMPFKCDLCDYDCLSKEAMQQHIVSVHEESSGSTSTKQKSNKICKSTWRGTKCQIKNCNHVHIAPCNDRECLALDVGLPLYKTRNCQFWHVRPKSNKSKTKKPKSGNRKSGFQNSQPQNKYQQNRNRSDPKSGNTKTNSKYFTKKGNLQQVVSDHEGKKPF